MGANCQNCSTVPPEVSIRHHHRYLNPDHDKTNTNPAQESAEGNSKDLRLSALHDSAHAFSKFYKF